MLSHSSHVDSLEIGLSRQGVTVGVFVCERVGVLDGGALHSPWIHISVPVHVSPSQLSQQA